MATAPSITLSTDLLWEVALEFRTWNYRLVNTATAPKLGPSYPGSFLQNLESYLEGRGASIFSREQIAEYRAMETRPPGPSTNCCMFVEAVIIGAALRSHADRLHWTSQYHNWAMVAPTRTESAADVVRMFGPVQAYVDAGLAVLPESQDEEPGEWCVVQGFTETGGHTYLILKCEDGKCLTLEANCWFGDRQSGFVGHRGNNKNPRRIADELPADWKSFAPTWKQIKGHYTRGVKFARLNVERPLKFTCPLDAEGLRSGAWRNYHNNESSTTGQGGYFVPGLYRNLHGGVHLFPPAPPKPRSSTPKPSATNVVTCAPGHVVAARLPGPGARALKREVLETIDNWPGFVLVRHEFRETGAPASDPPRAFYSLYMHLAAPTYASPAGRLPDGKPRIDLVDADPYLVDIPWFRELYRRRFGAWIRVRPGNEPVGTLYWSAEPVPAGSIESVTVHDSSKKLRVADADGPIYVHKPPPADLTAALAALHDGKVVTFAEPFFPVAAQEKIGVLAPLALDLPRADHERRAPHDRPPFLHWQILAPAGDDNAIARLVELAQQLVQPNGPDLFHKLDHAGTDNFLDLAAFHDKVGAALDPEERERHFEPAFAAFKSGEDPDYIDRNPVIELFDKGTTFAPGGWDEPPRTDPIADEFSYPIELQIEAPYLPPVGEHAGARSNGGYKLKLEFWQQDGSEFAPLGGYDVLITQAQLDQQKTAPPPKGQPPEKKYTTLKIRVPAQADKLTVTPLVPGVDGRPLESPPESEVLLFADAVKRRWRNVRLRYPNEWSADTADTTLKSILDKILHASELYGLQSPNVREFAWCDPQKEHGVGRIKHGPLDGQAIAPDGAPANKSLFSGDAMALRPTAELDSLHPITAVWLLNLLDRNKKIIVLDAFDARPFGSDDRPALAGWLLEPGADPKQLRLGQQAAILVINDDYLYDRKATVPLAISGPHGPIALPEAGYDRTRAGVATRPLELDFWGTWTIKAGKNQDGPRNPIGTAEITVATPAFAPLTDEESRHDWGATRAEGGRFTFAVKFAPPAPERLHGYASLKWRKQTDGDWRSAPLQQGGLYVRASAEPRAKPRGTDVDETMFDMESNYLVAPRRYAKQPNPTASFPWKAYVAAYKDIRLACSLAQALETLRAGGPAFSLSSLSRDGTACTIQVKQPRAPKGSKKTAAQLLKDAVDDITSRASSAGLTATTPPKPAGALDLALAGAPASIDACDALTAHAAALELDLDRRFIVRAAPGAKGKPQVSANFSLADYQARYDRSKIRLHINLAEALEALRKQSGIKLAIEYLSHDGNSCRLSVEPAKKLEAVRDIAAASRLFHGVHIDGKALALTLAPDSDDFKIVTVDAGPLLDDLAEQLADEDRVYYRFAFTGVSGRDLLTPDADRTESASLTKNQFDALRGKTDTVEYECPTDAGTFEKVSFAPTTPDSFTLQSSRTACAVALAVELRGRLEEWKHYRLKVTRTVDGTTKTDARAFAVGDRSTLMITCPLPSKPGAVTIKVEAVLASRSDRPGEHPLPAPLVATYDFKPKIVKVELQEDEAAGLLRIIADTDSLIPPAIAPAPGPAVTTRTAVGADAIAHALRVRIEPEGATDDAARDPIPVHKQHNPRRKRLSQLIEYALKAKGKTPAGYCDERGRFEATIKLALLDGNFKIFVERPGGEIKLPGGKSLKLDPVPPQSYSRTAESDE